MKNDVLVSIIVPAYNVEKYIERCLLSLKNQTYKQIEVIIIDDGSSDNTKNIIDNFINKYNLENFKLFSRENKGVLYTRLEGADLSSGKYLMYVDSDDWIDINYVEIYINNLDNNYDIVKGNYKVICDNKVKYKSELSKNSYNNKKSIYKLFLDGFKMNNVYCQLIKRELFNFNHQKLIESKIQLGDDLLINIELYKNVNNLKTINDCLYNYRSNENGITKIINREKRIKNMFDVEYTYSNYVDFIKNNLKEVDYYKAIIRYLSELNYSIRRLYFVPISKKYEEIYKIFNCKFIKEIRLNCNIGKILKYTKKIQLLLIYTNQIKLYLFLDLIIFSTLYRIRDFFKIIIFKIKNIINYLLKIAKKIKNKVIKINEKKYHNKLRKKLNNENFSIISNNCIGGVIYHNLGKKFCSPTINLYIDSSCFADFCSDIKYYSNCDMVENKKVSCKYPIGILKAKDNNHKDITINFVHYKSFEEAKNKWFERIERINYDNIFCIYEFYNSKYDVETLKKFDNLKYNKIALLHNDIQYIKNKFILTCYKNDEPIAKVLEYKGIFGKRYLDEFDYVKFLNNN